MTKRIVGGVKDANGIYLPPEKPASDTEIKSPKDSDVSLDDIGKRILIALDRATNQLLKSISAGNVERDVIGALKDCSGMYKELKKDEKDLLSSMSDSDIEKLIK